MRLVDGTATPLGATLERRDLDPMLDEGRYIAGYRERRVEQKRNVYTRVVELRRVVPFSLATANGTVEVSPTALDGELTGCASHPEPELTVRFARAGDRVVVLGRAGFRIPSSCAALPCARGSIRCAPMPTRRCRSG